MRVRGYPDNLVNKVLAEVKFKDRKSALQKKKKKAKSSKRINALHGTHNNTVHTITQYNPSVPNLKNILMSKWHLIENHPLLRETYREPPLISEKRGKSLKDILARPITSRNSGSRV